MDPAVKLFEDKIARLERSSLRAFMKEGWRWQYDVRNDCPGDRARMPELESLESYVLNLRFFLQNNESCSVQNIKTLYDSRSVDPKARAHFEQIRTVFNRELDKPVWFQFNDEQLSYRQVLEGVIYSQLAHSQVEKHSTLDLMMQNGLGNMLATDLFLRSIDFVHRCLLAMNELNRDVFGDA